MNSTLQATEKRALHRVMIEINSTLAAIHKQLPLKVDVERYKSATEYVSQFISYTSIWNVKFTYNLESPEVALMQILHLEYIFAHEHDVDLSKERAAVKDMSQLFFLYTPYSDALIEIRKSRFLKYIDEVAQ